VWRGEDAGGNVVVALKAWPGETTAEQLGQIHDWMAQASHLTFVPALFQTAAGGTVAIADGRCWDLTRWMLGAHCETPDLSQVENACVAVALLHGVWRRDVTSPSPGIQRRLEMLDAWQKNPAMRRPSPKLPTRLGELLHRATPVIDRLAPAAERALRPWSSVPLALQPCVRDLRGEHVLFRGAKVTGIVDFGAMQPDNPTLDLARLLGDLAGTNESFLTAGVRAYHEAGGDRNVTARLTWLLARVGAICSVIRWFTRLERPPDSGAKEAVVRRFTQLLKRIETLQIY
jgi:homoserine kinase type II